MPRPDIASGSFEMFVLRKTNKTSHIHSEIERNFACTTRYTKAHATMTWVIRDVSARDTHGERLRSVEFVVGRGSYQTAWIILCNFGTQNYEDYVSAHVKLVTKASQVCADVELSIVGAYGSKVNTETKVVCDVHLASFTDRGILRQTVCTNFSILTSPHYMHYSILSTPPLHALFSLLKDCKDFFQ